MSACILINKRFSCLLVHVPWWIVHGQAADNITPLRADPDEWDEQTMLNLAAPMRLTRHLVPEMVRALCTHKGF